MAHIGNSWLQTTQTMLWRRANVATVLGLIGLAVVIAFAASIMRSK